jgi:hypothetical protein
MWINPQTMQIFTTHSEIRSTFSNVSFPSIISEENIESVGVLPITLTTPPTFDRRIETVVEMLPIEVDDVWTQQWSVVPLLGNRQSDMANQIQSEIITATQQRLDSFAQTKFYDNILSLCSYATSKNPKFQIEGQYGLDARDSTWTKLDEILAEVIEGTRPMPSSYSDIESELPTLTWPN